MIWFKARIIVLVMLTRIFSFLLHIPLPPIISVMVIIQKEHKYLVLEVNNREGYNFLGGLVAPSETLEETVTREIKEETGLTVKKLEYLTSKNDRQFGFSILVTAFITQVEGEIANSKSSHAVWRTAEEIIKLPMYKNTRAAFMEYLELNK